MNRLGPRICAVAFALMIVSAACEAIVHIEDRVLVVAPKDAHVECPNRQVCPCKEPPPRPASPAATAGAADGGPPDLVFIVQSSNHGLSGTDDAGRPLWESVGFDLDETCTASGQPPGCMAPPWAAGDGGSHIDGVDGIDNAYGQQFYGQTTGDPIVHEAGVAVAPNTSIQMFRIHDYSGEADDDHVEVSLYIALAPPIRDDGSNIPQWDGSDRWPIMREMLSSAPGGVPNVDQPLYTDVGAYVSNGVLVANFGEALLPPLFIGAPLVHVTQFILAGTLARGDAPNVWELQDLRAGFRTPINEALISAASYPLGAGMFLCQDPASYNLAIKNLCGAVDTTADPNEGPSTTCDALSTGVIYQTKRARLGPVAPPYPAPPSCDGGLDPAAQRCKAP